MLILKLEATETEPACKLRLEHSLRSLSKWEQIFEKTFFGKEEKTSEESLTYIECMILNKNPPPGFLNRLTTEHVHAIQMYMNSSGTATTFREDPNKKPNRDVITTDVIYNWMIDFEIPFKADKWFYGRLMTLIRIRAVSKTKPKKMSRAEMIAERNKLNEERRQKLGSAG